jgi:hypothetical protein
VSAVLKLGEEHLTRLLTQWLSNDAFITALQAAIGGTLQAKGTLDKGMSALLTTFNVPTLEDVAALRSKVEELEDALADLTEVVDTLELKVAGPKRGKKGGRKASPSAAP